MYSSQISAQTERAQEVRKVDPEARRREYDPTCRAYLARASLV